MKKISTFLLLSIASVFILSPIHAQSEIDPHSPKLQSFIQQLKAQFFSLKAEQSKKTASILDRLKKYRFGRNSKKTETITPPNKDLVATEPMEIIQNKKYEIQTQLKQLQQQRLNYESKIAEADKNTYKSPNLLVNDLTTERFVSDSCKIISTCNGPTECVPANLNTNGLGGTCSYRPEIECYKNLTNRCEVQVNGRCGWTKNKELLQCIYEKKQAQFQSEGEPLEPINNQFAGVDLNNNGIPDHIEQQQADQNTYKLPLDYSQYQSEGEPLDDTQNNPGNMYGGNGLNAVPPQNPEQNNTNQYPQYAPMTTGPAWNDSRPSADPTADPNAPTFWTDWMNRDNPNATGDWEKYADFERLYPGQCPRAVDAECLLSDGRHYMAENQFIMKCNYDGFGCEHARQIDGRRCLDYKVRFKCQGTPTEPEEKKKEEEQPSFNTNFETNITYTPAEEPDYVPTQYDDTLTKDAETTTYQHGCANNNIDGLCDRYHLKTNYGESDPYQGTSNTSPAAAVEPTAAVDPPSDISTREQALFQQEQFNTPTKEPETAAGKLRRYSGESDYEARKRAQKILEMFRRR